MTHKKNYIYGILVGIISIVGLFTTAYTHARSGNDTLIDSGFWVSSPTSTQIIDAVFGDSSTAYSLNWTGGNTCDSGAMSVLRIAPGTDNVSGPISSNSIVVLESGFHWISTPLVLSGSCIAILGVSDHTFIGSTVNVPYLFDVTNYNTNVIFDGIKIMGSGNLHVGTPNTMGIRIGRAMTVFTFSGDIVSGGVFSGSEISGGVYTPTIITGIEVLSFQSNSTIASLAINGNIISGGVLSGLVITGVFSGDIMTGVLIQNHYKNQNSNISFNNLTFFDHGSYGISIKKSSFLQFTNMEGYNNLLNLIEGEFLEYIIINNLIAFNHAIAGDNGEGVRISGTGIAVNNGISFNNADEGFDIKSSNYLSLNNSMASNVQRTLLNLNPSSNLYLNIFKGFGTNDNGIILGGTNVFFHGLIRMINSASIVFSYTLGGLIPSLGWSTGIVDSSAQSLTNSLHANPYNQNMTPLHNNTPMSVNTRDGSWLSTLDVCYYFGNDVLKQQQPVRRNPDTLTLENISLPYDTNLFIGEYENRCVSEISITKTGNFSVITGESFVMYTLNYFNSGGQLSSGAVVTDYLGTGLEYLTSSIAPTSVVITATGTIITYNIGTIPSLSGGAIYLTAIVLSGYTTGVLLPDNVCLFANTGNISQSLFWDMNTGNNVSAFTIPIVGPVCSVIYNPSTSTAGPVIATLTGCNKSGIIVTNNGGSTGYSFSTNGHFTFNLQDSCGYTGNVIATVSWISTPSGGGGGGGGGGNPPPIDKCPTPPGDLSPSYYDGLCNAPEEEEEEEEEEESEIKTSLQNGGTVHGVGESIFCRFTDYNYNFTFLDIENHWAKGYADTLRTACIAKGYDDEKKFYPEAPFTRAEAIKVLTKIGSYKNDNIQFNENAIFEGNLIAYDVDRNNWLATYLPEAMNIGILNFLLNTQRINGRNEKILLPEEPLTRKVFIKMLMKTYMIVSNQPDLVDNNKRINSPFVDVTNKFGQYYAYIVTAHKLGFIDGVEVDGKRYFYPDNNLTRGEAAKLIVLPFLNTIFPDGVR